MKRQMSLLIVLCTIVAVGASWADSTIPGTVTPSPTGGTVLGSIWIYNGSNFNPGDAGTLPSGSPDAQFYSNGINYNSYVGGYTIGGFLNNPAFFNTSGGFSSSATANNIYLEFTGSTYLFSGANSFDLIHDDGAVLTIGGVTVLNQPGPTSPVSSPFTVNAPAGGFYNFTLTYTECCGAPAELIWDVNNAPVSNAPEPASIALMTTGLVLVGSKLRRRRAK